MEKETRNFGECVGQTRNDYETLRAIAIKHRSSPDKFSKYLSRTSRKSKSGKINWVIPATFVAWNGHRSLVGVAEVSCFH